MQTNDKVRKMTNYLLFWKSTVFLFFMKKKLIFFVFLLLLTRNVKIFF